MLHSNRNALDFHFITAIGTPVDQQEQLHEEGLEKHLVDQWSSGIHGILVAGTMGMMQLLRDQTYQQLVRRAVKMSKGKGEILVGAGDAALARTLDRVEFLNQFPIDGIVILTPYFHPVTQEQLTDYFLAVADAAKRPVYLYDLPAVSGVAINLETYTRLARHPNIRGAKVSGRVSIARQLVDRLGSDFRVVVSEPDMLDVLLRHGITEHLDGMFAVAPQWVMELGRAASNGDWDTASIFQQKLTALRNLLLSAPSSAGAFTAMMNARGIPGNFHAGPYPALTKSEHQALVNNPIMVDLLGQKPPAITQKPKTLKPPVEKLVVERRTGR
jgi:4-hydroxy-tetrahydrodipicolinate synthase